MILFAISQVNKERTRIKKLEQQKIIEITNEVKDTLFLHLEISPAFQITMIWDTEAVGSFLNYFLFFSPMIWWYLLVRFQFCIILGFVMYISDFCL